MQVRQIILSRPHTSETDTWIYSWRSPMFSTSRAYKALVGHRSVHPTFLWIWGSKCQMKHKVFFWLLLKDRLSTRDLLGRKNMILDTYSCELCLRPWRESVTHLFFRCPFAKGCWNAIGVTFISTRPLFQILKQIKSKLGVTFFMEVIILLCLSIWHTRNYWMFEGVQPWIQDCKRHFITEFSLVLHRAKYRHLQHMMMWLEALWEPLLLTSFFVCCSSLFLASSPSLCVFLLVSCISRTSCVCCCCCCCFFNKINF
jgi:hypothetical protein